MKKKTPRQKLEREIEKLLKAYIVKRDNSTCQHCGRIIKGSNRHLSHVIPRSKSRYLKYNIKNVKLLCMSCHLYWWHKDPTAAAEWFKGKFPKRYEYLEARRNVTEKLDLELIKHDLEARLKL